MTAVLMMKYLNLSAFLESKMGIYSSTEVYQFSWGLSLAKERARLPVKSCDKILQCENFYNVT